MESRPTQAALPLVGLATEKVIRDRYDSPHDCQLVQESVYHKTMAWQGTQRVTGRAVGNSIS
ncbi:MAG: hypothetical protein ACQESR_13110 [Planctomycetota bacterium]